MKKIGAAGIVTLGLLCADYAVAQNQLTNPDFDSDVIPWAAEAEASVIHNASEGSPSPGSAEVTNSSTGASNGTGILQCGGGSRPGASTTTEAGSSSPPIRTEPGTLRSDCAGG